MRVDQMGERLNQLSWTVQPGQKKLGIVNKSYKGKSSTNFEYKLENEIEYVKKGC